MKGIKSIVLKPYLLIWLCFCLGLFFLFLRFEPFKANASKKQVSFAVKNLVPELTVIQTEVQGDMVLLSLRNDSKKSITAFSVSSSNIITRNELLDTDKIIAPGDINIGAYELPLTSSPKNGLTVLAVVFDDGTTSGDPEFIRQIIDARAGEQAQMTRMSPILQEALVSLKNVNPEQKWKTLKLRIAQLPNCEDGKSFEYCAALHDAKELLLDKIMQLEQIQQERGDDIAQQVMTHIKERYKRKSILLQHSLK
ncbi:MAG TPA: hypothetical protein VLR90_14000 [Blastocatellia bacterium]|nr:hypothetical protein [Blastocatellia bacterium]